MRKLVVLGMGLFVALAFTSCKSSESAYKKAYEKAKSQELASAPAEETVATPVAAESVVAAPVQTSPATNVGTVREEKVELVSGDGLKAYSVVCGSFGVKANAEGVKQRLDGEGYSAKVVYNAERNMYRVVVASYDDRMQAAQARDDFKAKHPDNADYQKAWLLYRVY